MYDHYKVNRQMWKTLFLMQKLYIIAYIINVWKMIEKIRLHRTDFFMYRFALNVSLCKRIV